MDATRSVPNTAELTDRLRRYFVFAMLVFGLVFAARAGEELLDGTAARAAEVLAAVGVVVMFYCIGRVALWKVRNRSISLKDPYCDDDGFYAATLARAHTASWVVTFVFVILVSQFDNLLAELDGFVLIHIVAAVMTTSFGVCFFWLARDRGEVDAESARA